MRYIALLLLSLAASFASLAQAQEPPGRVGRLAYTQGTVSVYQDPELGWDKAHVNTPITSENSVWTERGSRAELRVAGTAVRLDETTQLDVSRLDDDGIDASIERGAANIRVRYKQPNDRITFSTPQARFTIQADGRYRMDVDSERDESRLTVFAGDARMESQSGRIRVNAGSTVRVFGGPSSSYVMERAKPDAFDRWADARDREWSDNRARQYVSTEMTGYEELDRYGEWAQEPDYGALWFPTRVASDWAPYSTGHWSYVQPWGFTWVDDAPWGYAPFHYGRWVNVRNRWAWSPGQRVSRPAWAPALVGWVGGNNWNVTLSSGGSSPVVGWYPLAPWERYEPWYRSNRANTDRLNVVVRDRTPRQYEDRGDDWRGFNRDRGATVVQRDALIDRRPVQNARVEVGVDALRQQKPVAPAQVQQMLPQGNEMIRRRADRPQAPVAAPPVQQAQQQQQDNAQQARGNEAMRPRFGRAGAPVPAPSAAPGNQPPVQQAAPAAVNPFNPAAAPAANPAARGQAPQQSPQQQQQPAREAQQQQERAQREAQQQERARAEAQAQQQNQLQQQQRQAREAQQQQERAQRDGQQQREAQQAQERARAEALQQQQAQQQRQAREAQQAQDRAQRDGQQQREAQQAQERARVEAQQQQQAQQQRQAREAQQAQERARAEAQQQQQRQQGQLQQQQERAAREAQQQAQRAAQEAQQAAQRAAQEAQQQQNRAARGQPQPSPAQPAQPVPAQPAQPQPAQPQPAQPQPAQPQPANPAARGNREQQQRDKEEKDKKDKEDKQR